VGFVNTGMIHHQGVGDQQIQSRSLGSAGGLAHAVAQHLAAPELAFLPVNSEILFHLDDQGCVAEAHPIARGRSIHVGVRGAVNGQAHGRSPWGAAPERGAGSGRGTGSGLDPGSEMKPLSRARSRAASRFGPSKAPEMSPLPPYTMRSPESLTMRTVLISPGSKRTAVPLGMRRRISKALVLSYAKDAFVSKKG